MQKPDIHLFITSKGKDCGIAPTVANSSRVTTNTLYQGTSTYSCDQGYEETAGNTVLTCGTDGTWNGTTPQCDSMYGNYINRNISCL